MHLLAGVYVVRLAMEQCDLSECSNHGPNVP